MNILKSVAGYFVGEDSKKRQMGLGAAFVLSGAYFLDYISLGMYEACMPFVMLWTGAAFSAKISKLSNAVKDAKK
jgi:hypothetical protein|tara:strand:- start:1422 stop:1646 length:225 start_codon:yes stop_codon:yes gene_type:complete